MLRRFLPFLVLASLAPAPLLAIETVKSPIVDEGLLELEEKGKISHDQNPSRDDENEFEFNAGYGVTDYWKPKIEFTLEQKRGSDFHYKSTRWENTLNLNGRDVQHEVIFGLYNELVVSERADYAHYFLFGGIARRDFEKLANTANLFIKRDMGEAAQQGVSVIYRWQTKYAALPELQPGFEALGDTQHREAFRDQSLAIGPMLYGSFAIGDTKGFGYETGYLFGVTPATRDGAFRWKLKYSLQL